MDAESGIRMSPSATKPGIVAKALKGSDIPVEFLEPKPLQEEEITAAHDPEYVRGVLSGKIPNGFENCSWDVAGSCLIQTVQSRTQLLRHSAGHRAHLRYRRLRQSWYADAVGPHTAMGHG